jgi:hypothetical protein
VAKPTRLLPEEMVEPLLAALLDASLGQGDVQPAAW